MDAEISKALSRVLPFVAVLLIIIVQAKRGKLDTNKIDLQMPSSIMLMFGIWVGYLFYILGIEFITFKAGYLDASQWHYGLPSSIIRLIGSIILAPIVEEILFRGLILNALVNRNIKYTKAIMIQAIVFVLMHNIEYQNNFQTYYTIAYGLMDSILFALVRKKTGSLYTSMGMHIIGNSIAIAERFIL